MKIEAKGKVGISSDNFRNLLCLFFWAERKL